jgi:hypothetical protein
MHAVVVEHLAKYFNALVAFEFEGLHVVKVHTHQKGKFIGMIRCESGIVKWACRNVDSVVKVEEPMRALTFHVGVKTQILPDG